MEEMEEYDVGDIDTFDDEALLEFCQADTSSVDVCRLPINHSAKLTFDENLEPLTCMIEHAIMTLVGDILEKAKTEERFEETDVILLHVTKKENVLSIAQDVHSDRRGIAVRETCEAVIVDGEVVFV
jgi:hypothetical protein